MRVLTRDPAKTNFPEVVEVAKGDLLDIESLRNAFSGITSLFLLNAVTGDDPSEFEQNMATFMPKWTAYEMRLMAERYVSDGMIPQSGDVERLTRILGRSLHSYRSFAETLFSQTIAKA